jgi:hypothetical protein
MTKRNPDHELQLMQRVLRDLAKLSPAGRRRATTYWANRIEELPEQAETHGDQQLDIEDALASRLGQIGQAPT